MRDLVNDRVHDYYWRQDLNCATTTLKVLSELFNTDIDPQVISATFGLNAGRAGTQCGLIEGALMFIGLYGEQQQMDDSKIRKLCRGFVGEFQRDFGSLVCSQLRPQGFSLENPPHLCENLSKRAIVFSAEFIARSFAATEQLNS